MVHDMALSDHETHGLDATGWQYGFKCKTEHIWDVFILLSLLFDHETVTNNSKLSSHMTNRGFTGHEAF